jgi:ribosome assembly protein 1
MLVSHRAKRKEDNEDEDHDDEQEEQRWIFEPQRGNIIFGSALFGWGFTVPSLARSLFKNKIVPIKPAALKQYLFGDFYFKVQQQKMMKLKVSAEQQTQLPLFAEFGLLPIWEIYEGVAAAASACGLGSAVFSNGRIAESTTSKNKSNSENIKIQATTPGMDQVLQAMQIGCITSGQAPAITTLDTLQKVMTRTGSASSEDAVLRSLLRRFRPLSDIVLNTLYEICPSPNDASKLVRPRALALAPRDENEEKKTETKHDEDFERVEKAVRGCDVSTNAVTVAHVCKFMAADQSHIRDPGSTNDNDDTVILGLVRVLSGRLKTGSMYHVMGPKHNFNDPKGMQSRPVRLFLLMGSSFVLVDEVPAGHLCAIQNLENFQYKTATICDSPHGMPLLGFSDMEVRPLVKVNVEAVDPADTYMLERGLIQLSLADAAVEVTATAKGERILACLGELHLEQSILDLQKVYCEKKDIQLRISEPIVEFGETTAWFEDREFDFEGFLSEKNQKGPPMRQMTIPPYNEEEGNEFAKRGRSRSIVSGRVAAVSLRVVPLDPMVYKALQEGKLSEDSIDAINQLGRALGFKKGSEQSSVLKSLVDSLISLDDSKNAIVASSALEGGLTVAGVLSDRDEVHVPDKLQALNVDNDEVDNDNHSDAPESALCGVSEYEMIQREIRENGFLPKSCEGQRRTLAPHDVAACHIWKEQMKGSLVAGFKMAMRAGPICEEPVRSVLVVLEGLEVALKEDHESEDGYHPANSLSGGMMAAALRIGIRSALL